MVEINPAPAIYKLYNNDISELQKYRLSAAKRCSDSCNRIKRNYDITNDEPYDNCLNNCQTMVNAIMQYENDPTDLLLYNTQGYWGSYGNYGDHYFKNGNKEQSLKQCLIDCSNVSEDKENIEICKENCVIDMYALKDINIENRENYTNNNYIRENYTHNNYIRENYEIKGEKKNTNTIIQLLLLIAVIIILIFLCKQM
jgi:hypothetical protein